MNKTSAEKLDSLAKWADNAKTTLVDIRIKFSDRFALDQLVQSYEMTDLNNAQQGARVAYIVNQIMDFNGFGSDDERVAELQKQAISTITTFVDSTNAEQIAYNRAWTQILSIVTNGGY